MPDSAAVFRAIRDDKPQEVLAAIKAGWDPNGTYLGVAPLTSAIQKGRTSLVKLLLDHGADPAKRDRASGWSPLMLATIQTLLPPAKYRPARIATENRRIVKILVDAGARDAETLGVLGRIDNESALLRSVLDFGATPETEVVEIEGVVVVYPKRLQKSAVGRWTPRETLLQVARKFRLTHLEALLKEPSRL
jgi:ankyrin repeat protein